jgi:hypothetical protein
MRTGCKGMKKTFLVLLIIVLHTCCLGCASHVNNIMKSWMNKHYSDLIMSWGSPNEVYDDGLDGRIFIYTSNRQWTEPGTCTTTTTGTATIYGYMIWAQAESVSTFTPPQTRGLTAWRMFRINRNGILYAWSWKGH